MSLVRGRSNPWLYFLLAFGWSWLVWSPPVLFGWEWGELRTLISFALGFGPLVATLVLIYLRISDEPPSAFWRRVFDIRQVPLAWWVVIVGLTFGLNLAARLFPAGTASVDRDPLTIGMVIFAIVVFGLGAGFAEELGWRGYALDPLQKRYTALTASLIIGVAWSAWHLPLFLIEGSYQHGLGIGTVAFWLYMAWTVLWSVLFTWIYNHTNRSILAMIVLHALINIASETAGPAGDQEYARMVILAVVTLAVILIWGHRTLGTRETWSARYSSV